MRLFVALDFQDHKDYFERLQQQLSGMGRLTFPKSFHLTLKFLGEIPDPKKIESALSDIRLPSFELKLGSPGVFPSPASVRVIWVGVEPAEDVVRLQQEVDKCLGNPDKRFHPHITLARVKDIRDKARLREFLESKTEPRSQRVESFHLIQSVLTLEGPLYGTLATFPLGNP